MLRFPVMVAAGGINSAGRTSQRHAYRRMIWISSMQAIAPVPKPHWRN